MESAKNPRTVHTIGWRRHFYEVVEEHPFEIGLSIALILFGSRSLIGGLQSLPKSVHFLPIGLAFTYCALSVIGGSAVLMGLFSRSKLTWAYGVERFGLFVSASAWGSYMAGILLGPLSGSATLVILSLAALSIGCLLRARAINRRAKATMVGLRYAQHEKEAPDGRG